MTKPITVIATPEQIEKYGQMAHKAFWDVAINMAMDLTVDYESLSEEAKDVVEDQLGRVLLKYLEARKV
jgi:hypothetical protein